MSYSRRDFFRIVPTLGAFAVGGHAMPSFAQTPDPLAWPGPAAASGAPVDESFPTQHASLAKEMVGVSHSNLARVKELVQQYPSLAKASWDWGFGDWETALGAASHTGQRAIAEFLLQNGAPPTLFSATMLGQLEVVKAFAAQIPDVQLQRGPHSIPLVNHARAGGPPAAAVLAMLEAMGPPQNDQQPLNASDRDALVARYVFGDRPRDALVVDAQQGLGVTRIGTAKRFLTHRGDWQFYPSGAPAVRIAFERDAQQHVVGLAVFDPDLVVRARKV